jgi:CheY-like chemotaxis protein
VLRPTDSSDRILIAEDDGQVRGFLSTVLSGSGLIPIEAPDGETALAQLAQSHIDLLLLDVNLPGMDGFEVLRNVKSRTPGLPVIMLTGAGSIQSAVQALKAGADDYLAKPVAPKALLHAIRRSLAAAQGQEAGHAPGIEMQKLSEDARRRAEKVEAMQQQLDNMKPNLWFVTYLGPILALFAVVIAVTIGAITYIWAGHNADVRHEGEAITKVEKAVEEHRNEQIRMFDLIREGRPKRVSGALVYGGKVVRVAGNTLVILDGEIKKEITVVLSDDAEITVKGLKAKLSDLKPDIRVQVLTNDGLAVRITAPD